MARTNSTASQIVAVAWVRGSVTNAMVHAISGRQANACGGQIAYLVNKGYLEKAPNCGCPGRWRLTADRIEAIVSLPDHDSLRTQAELVAQRMERVMAIRESTKPERLARRHFALPGSRSPALPGRDLVAPEPAGMPAPVTVAAPRVCWGNVPVQDTKVLLRPSAEALAAADPFRLRGGLLAPADGPYIRPGALAAQAVPSRRADSLVPHRPPLSQP